MTKIVVKCAQCNREFLARIADRKRGWGIFCSKSCKAIKQEKRTGQYTSYLNRKNKQHKYIDYEKDFHIMDPYSLGQE